MGCSPGSFKNKLWEALNNMCQARIFTDSALRPIQSSSQDVCLFACLSVYPECCNCQDAQIVRGGGVIGGYRALFRLKLLACYHPNLGIFWGDWLIQK